MATVVEAVLALVPEAQVTILGEYPDYEITWNVPDTPPVTNAEIDAKYLELVAKDPLILCKEQAKALLQATDWVNQPDVRDPANSPHLTNTAEFDAYRLAVRQYAVYPVVDPVWPILPIENWVNT